MKLKSTADGLKAVKVNPNCPATQNIDYITFERNNMPLDLTTPMPCNTVFEGVEVWQYQNGDSDNWYNVIGSPTKYQIEKYGYRLAYQPFEVKEQVREEAETADENFWNDLAGDERDDENRSPREEYLDAVISLRKQEASNPELGVAIRTPNYFLNIRMKDNDVSLSGWEYDTVIGAMLDYANHLKTLKQ